MEGKYVNVYNTETNEVEKQNKKDFYDKILMSSLNITNLLYDKIKDNVCKKKQVKLKIMINELENIAHVGTSKQICITNFNQIGYNKKKIIKDTWLKKNKLIDLNSVDLTVNDSVNNLVNDPVNDSVNDLINDSVNNLDSDSDSSTDSFYYVTDSDSDSD